MSVYTNDSDIALIGFGCRFPGEANSPSKLWDLIHSPRQVAQPIPPDRFSAQGFYHEKRQYHGHFNVKEGYFLAGEGICRRFDASFFGMNSAEAASLDPQSRLLLETVFEALEDSGLTIEGLRGSDTAVYAGQMTGDYDHTVSRDTDHSLGIYHGSGTSHAILSNRISYFYDWHGPSMTIDTACSSSLVALHHAVQQLRTRQSRVAVAAGANLIIDPETFVSLSSLNMLSPGGRCRMWDADADGYARGEGVAAIVLKTLSAALHDGDEILCIIRETGFAQDGKTQGITSPNHLAQTQLIRDCYSRAGLDLSIPADRPQFFECHGTGTLAGDAAEAEAIKSAFFPDSIAAHGSQIGTTGLLVGSIKSVIGHTEGTAGIAGVLKAALALRHAVIPPNLLFNRLNPMIQPFYEHLQVSTVASPWPPVESGQPRRASVNSFGFGGANAHAILESYESHEPVKAPQESSMSTVFTPFVFSASSKVSLLAYLEKFLGFLQASSPTIGLRDLGYTLRSRRTSFPLTVAVTALDIDELCNSISDILREAREKPEHSVVNRLAFRRSPSNTKPKILGIFTGQGAQWAGMGSHLLKTSKAAKQILDRLELRLTKLPVSDRPKWSLTQVLMDDSPPSHIDISEAALSQPICTAIQILQVELLQAAGIRFAAVVGHSSGEIAAAYASGFISAEDAICIAYYRGFHAHLASGCNGVLGAMMAVGTTAEDALELCNQPEFVGRLSIAAINSPTSITISGDQDAIEELRIIFEDENKFVRILKVDKAYHSHHMTPCSAAYVDSLMGLQIQIENGKESVWFSSVFEGEDMLAKSETLLGPYWNENMINPVLFKQAVSHAIESQGPFDLAIEIGPHAVLRGPVMQIAQDSFGTSMSYTSMFSRGASAVRTISECLGYALTHLGKEVVNLHNYDIFVSGDSVFNQIKGLPSYAWEHGDYWNESRYARAIRTRPGPVHELLGHITPDSNQQDLRWRHILEPSETPWLLCHRLHGQIVFPAAAYVATAVEAALAVGTYQHVSVSLMEFFQFEFDRALVFNNDKSSIEVIVAMSDIVHKEPNTIEANFKYHASDDKDGSKLELFSTCKVRITTGDHFPDILPQRAPKPPCLIGVSADEFYSVSRDLGYEWTGPFVALGELERKLGFVTGYLNTMEASPLLIQPAMLDAAFQGIILGYSYPDDGQLWTVHVPKRIKRLSINPSLCANQIVKGRRLPFVASHDPDTIDMTASSTIYPRDTSIENAMIQVEELECSPLSRATAQDDKEAFATILWDVADPCIEFRPTSTDARSEHQRLAHHLEWMLRYYAQSVDSEFSLEHPSRSNGLYVQFLQYARTLTSSSQDGGQNSHWTTGWENNPYETLDQDSQRFLSDPSVQLLRLVGESVNDAIKDARPTIEVTRGLARHFYTEGLGLDICNQHVAHIMKQLSHRYPQLSILEIGSRTGATMQAILDSVQSTFSRYIFTDISSHFFESARASAGPYSHKIVFQTLNINDDPLSQGLSESSFDVVIASLVLHTTANAERTLRGIRRLLKPGGRLLVVEPIPKTYSVYEFILRALPQWWNGSSPPQPLGLVEWDCLLRKTGFSGCDISTPKSAERECLPNFMVFFTQAMDEKTAFLRHPLATTPSGIFQPGALIQDLILLGGDGPQVAKLVEDITTLAGWYCGRIRTCSTLLDVTKMPMSFTTTVLSLTQLETSIFQNLNSAEWDALKILLMTTGALLWVTRGRRASNPFAAMTVGLVRSVIREIPTLRYQMLDFEAPQDINARGLTEALLRFQAEHLWQKEESIHTSIENELVVENGGRVIIPRLVMSSALNTRYNSHRRPITTLCEPQAERLRLLSTKSGYELRQGDIGGEEKYLVDSPITVTHSGLSAMRLDNLGYMFLFLGDEVAPGVRQVGFSTTNCSITKSSMDLSVVAHIRDGFELEFISQLTLRLLAHTVFSGLSPDDLVLAYEPKTQVAAVFADVAHRRGVKLTFITGKQTNQPIFADCEWVEAHKSAPISILSQILPKNASVFVDLAGEAESKFHKDRITSILPLGCRQESLATLLAAETWLPINPRFGLMRKILQQAVDRTLDMLSEVNSIGDHCLPIIPVSSISDIGDKPALLSILNWKSRSSVLVKVQQSADRIAFSNQNTYWLVGLSRGLGLALCEWMARHGARYFVITSRKPKIESSWLDQMCKAGAVVKVTSCDITVRDQVVSTYNEIRNSMPPIIGVCQGAMVLQDTAIRDMTIDDFLAGTRPKVEGSTHLNALFQENTLDFFVFFSSVASTIGRPGQANYSAANMFMSSLAEQRRRKNLAASVIHLGPIYGVGLAAHLDRTIYSRAAFRSMALVPTSERDFYQLFTEAIISGRPNSECNTIELLSGLRRVSPHEKDRPVWESESLMSHFVQNGDAFGATVPTNQSKIPIKQQLAQATTRSQLYDIIRDAFLPKFYIIFRIDPENVDVGDLINQRLDSLGVDSLLATEMRGWFMKTLEVNIPALKILSGVPINDLLVLASKEIPKRLVPGLIVDEDVTSTDELLEPQDDNLIAEPQIGEIADNEESSIDSPNQLDDSLSYETQTMGSTSSSVSQEMFRLSFSQEMFWFLWVYLQDKASLNHTAWARITGKINTLAFREAFYSVGQYHEALRTRIIEKDGTPFQVIMNTTALDFEVRHITDDEEVQRCLKSLQTHVYDIARGQTVRAMLLSKSTEEHYFVAGLNPFIADGLSFQSLWKGVQQYYVSGGLYKPTAARSFLDYSENQHHAMAKGDFENDIKFWRDEFSSIPPPLPILSLSSSVSRPDLAAYENVQVSFDIGLETKEQIKSLCRRCATTPFHFYLSVFRALLLRFSRAENGEDITIGIGDANRADDDMMDVIGPFVNFLPLRLRANASDKFTELLYHTRDKVYSALSHSKVPFQVLLNQLEVPRSASYTSLFQCFVNYRQGLRKTTNWDSGHGALTLHAMEIGIPNMGYDITLEMVDYVDSGCTQMIALRKDMYSETEAQRLLRSYERLLYGFLADPTLRLHQPDPFPPEDISKVMSFSCGPSLQSKWPETVIHRFEQVAQTQPERIAIQESQISTTYKETSLLKNAVATALKRANLAPGAVVAVLMEPSCTFIISLLGIMQAGGVYLPLDLSWPLARVGSIIRDCQPHVILVDQTTDGLLSSLGHSADKIINITNIDKDVNHTPLTGNMHSPAALLYTSGSSGTPKGILIKHEGLRNWVEFTTHKYNVGSEVVLQQTAPTFDLSLVQIFTALCLGGKLCLVPRKQRADAQAISEIITTHSVTFTCATPSEYTSWLHYGKQEIRKSKLWKTAFCSGEPIPRALPSLFRARGLTGLVLHNLYGPTETSLTATGSQVPLDIKDEVIAAGQPLPNYSVYVLDDNSKPVPVGVQGEIYIGGAGVGLGYFNQAKLTDTKFVPNCFATPRDRDSGWTMMHRTGDLGRWSKDGALLIEGRIDTQIKLRGMRIDLSEIEQAIVDTANGAVSETVVSLRKYSPSTPECLVAYAVFKSGTDVARKVLAIKSRLAERLPQYMCPVALIELERLPATSSGKLDRVAVSNFGIHSRMDDTKRQNEDTIDTVLTDTEIRLKKTWEQTLSFSHKITPSSDFFHIGGSSILLLKLQVGILETFGVRMPLIRMFESSTIHAMANWIDEGSNGATDSSPVDWAKETSLSPTLLSLDTYKYKAKHSAVPRVVVLTGASGKLGKALLERLVADPNVEHVHCIGVRDIQCKEDIRVLSPKIKLYEGDLVLPRLGLSEEAASVIFGSADVVLHNGADMSYLKSYDTLREMNLQSTKTLVDLSAQYQPPGRVAFHYISTISVGNVVMTAILKGNDVYSEGRPVRSVEEFIFRPFSVAAYPPPSVVSVSDTTKTAYGYIASKWASEVFLERLCEKFPQWPIVIHRPSFIARDQSLGTVNNNPSLSLEFVENIGRYATLIGAVPSMPIAGDEYASVDGALNVVSLADVTKGVVDAIVQDTPNAEGIKFLHHLGDLELPLNNLRSWVTEGGNREEVREMDTMSWAQKAADLGMHPTMVALLEDLATVKGRLSFPRLGK